MEYQPEYKLSDESIRLQAEISELLGQFKIMSTSIFTPLLRKTSRIRSIHSSLAIEANSLTNEQVTAIVNGRRVLGPKKDIDEVKDAFAAYNSLLKCDPYSVKDLLKEHGLMMEHTSDEAGRFRSHGEAVVNGFGEVVHLAPPASFVPREIENLLKWVKESSLPQVTKSCIFHYEFEFIHPFGDGNGRMGRMWQTLLLYKEHNVFSYIPIETVIKANQQAYYRAIMDSTAQNDSGIFAEFMLRIIKKALSDFSEDYMQPDDPVEKKDQERVIAMLQKDRTLTYYEIAKRLNCSEKTVERIMAVLKEEDLVSRVGSKKTGYWRVNLL